MLLRVLGFVVAMSLLTGASIGAEKQTPREIEFARVDGQPLLLDLYSPAKHDTLAPVIVWVHGGAWRGGSRKSPPAEPLVNHGYAIASVDYRLSPVAKFPAQAHDIKAAIRYLRAHAGELHLDGNRFVVAGSSAGGHLAALVGVSNGQPDLEGTVGDNRDQSSDVQAVVSFFGASNLETILDQSTPHGLDVRVPALDLLLGGQPKDRPELARLASPVTRVDADDPPLLLIHGDQDPQMPINQSHELQGAYEDAGRPVEFIVVHGAGHGGKGFFEPVMLDRVAEFLKKSLAK